LVDCDVNVMKVFDELGTALRGVEFGLPGVARETPRKPKQRKRKMCIFMVSLFRRKIDKVGFAME